uniref:Mucin-3A n=1 Tax=Camelus bactrianus TaxID=9837 RepID=A0A9W3EML7_CAMBA
MQLLRLLRLLWMLRVSLGATGTSAMATSTSNTLLRAALSNYSHSKGTGRWPLNISKIVSLTPDSRENIPMTIITSPHFKSISETLLNSRINSNTSTIPMSKLVFKVETTPPTMIVYMSRTDCINPTSLLITTTYPTTTCMTQNQVNFTNSYTTTPKIEKPQTSMMSISPMTTTRRVTSGMASSTRDIHKKSTTKGAAYTTAATTKRRRRRDIKRERTSFLPITSSITPTNTVGSLTYSTSSR